MKYRLKTDLTEETFEFPEGNKELTKGLICYTAIWHRSETIMHAGKAICDTDSQMAEDYFEPITA